MSDKYIRCFVFICGLLELLRNLWSLLTHSPRADTTSEELGEKEIGEDIHI